jgi:hypothetical protein
MDPLKDPPSWLQDRCRVCGGKLSRYKVSYDCHTTINRAKLALIGVITADDNRAVHPQRFCYGCSNVCKRAERAGKEGKDYTPRLTRFEWGESSEAAVSKVGPKLKKAPVGRPSFIVLELVAHMKEVAPPSIPLTRDLREKLSRHPSMDGDLKCVLCNLMLDRPLLLTTCNKLICMSCCVGHTYTYTDLRCPCDGAHIINTSSIIPAPAVVQRMLRDITFPCDKCQRAVPAGMCVHKRIIY